MCAHTFIKGSLCRTCSLLSQTTGPHRSVLVFPDLRCCGAASSVTHGAVVWVCGPAHSNAKSQPPGEGIERRGRALGWDQCPHSRDPPTARGQVRQLRPEGGPHLTRLAPWPNCQSPNGEESISVGDKLPRLSCFIRAARAD